MIHARSEQLPPEKLLGMLAMKFRSTRDDTVRVEIAAAYALAIAQLIESGKWHEIPPLEDQLPDNWMPETFFTYWSLGHSTPRASRKA